MQQEDTKCTNQNQYPISAPSTCVFEMTMAKFEQQPLDDALHQLLE
jgi:hypothetical protein